MNEAPILAARPCPDAAMPANVASAVRKAAKFGWNAEVSIAIGPPPDGIRSVQMVLTKGATRLMSRHEGDTAGASMGFAQAYRTSKIHRGIFPLGWNELVASIEHDGVPPRPKPTPKATKELTEARQLVSDQITGSVGVAVIDPRPLCKSMVEPGVRCNRQADPYSTLCAGPCSTNPDW